MANKSGSSQPEVSVKEPFVIPYPDQRGISNGYTITGDYNKASEYIDPKLEDLSISGLLSMSRIAAGGTYQFGSGNVAAPGISWAADTDSGYYWISSGKWGISSNGVKVADWSSSGLTLNLMTAGSVLFAGTGGLVSQDNSHFFWDDSSNFLGIGTASPTVALDVNGDIRDRNMTQGSVLFAGASGVVSQDNSNFFWDDSNNRLGIGCTNPWKALEVRSSSSQLVLSLDDNNAVLFQGNGLALTLTSYSTQAAAEALDLSWTGGPVGYTKSIQSVNTDNSNTSSHAAFVAQVGGTSAGDAYSAYSIAFSTNWAVGLDNSDSDKFKISKNATLGTNDYLTISTTGDISSQNAALNWDNTNLIETVTVPVSNLTTRALNYWVDSTDPDVKKFALTLGDAGIWSTGSTRRDVVMNFGYNLNAQGCIDSGDVAWGLQFETYACRGAQLSQATGDVEFFLIYTEPGGYTLRPIGVDVDRTTHVSDILLISTNFNHTGATDGAFTATEGYYSFGGYNPATGNSTVFLVTGAAYTNITASTEKIFANFDAQTNGWTWATGAISSQRFFLIGAPTINFAGASTVTNTATFAIAGAPVAGTNATLTNSYALWVQGGQSLYQGNVTVQQTSAAAATSQILVDNRNSSTTLTAGLQLSTAASANVWQVFARNGEAFLGISGVADYIRWGSATFSYVNPLRIGALKTDTPDSGVQLHLGKASTTQGYIRLESTGGSRAGNIYAPSGGGIQMDTATNSWNIELNGNAILLHPQATSVADVGTSGITFFDSKNIILGTSTGTKIGTATSQKLGFFNATPVIQQAGTGETVGFTAGGGTTVTDSSTFTGNVGSTAYGISDVVKALKNLGLIAQ